MALTEGRHTGEFILSIGNGNISFDNATLSSGENLAAGSVLALVAEEYVQIVPGSSSSEQDAAGILLAAVDASSAAKACVVVVRQAEVNGAALVWPTITAPQKAAAIVQLAALGVIVR